MNSNALFVVLMASVVALAALILWLRDKRRDRNSMPQDARKNSEKRLRGGVNLIFEVAAGIGILASIVRKGAYGRDILFGAAFAGFLWLEWKRWTSGMRRTENQTSPKTAGASAVDENWKPPGMPPPIG